jgi:hypothetical protein
MSHNIAGRFRTAYMNLVSLDLSSFNHRIQQGRQKYDYENSMSLPIPGRMSSTVTSCLAHVSERQFSQVTNSTPLLFPESAPM